MVGQRRDAVVEPGGPGCEVPRGADPATGSVAEVLGGYLHGRATEFLRGLRGLGGHPRGTGTPSGPGAAAGRVPVDTGRSAVDTVRAAARRLGGVLFTYRPLVEPVWADELRTELSWLAGTLGREHVYAAKLEKLLAALHRLAGDGAARERGDLPVGAARAAALLDRRLTLARTRAHSEALHALGSARFHAVADAVALLASEAPLRAGAQQAGRPAGAVLGPLAEQAGRHLAEAAAVLPLSHAGAPYNADGLSRSLAGEARQDAAWDQVRVLLRRHRYAVEVLGGSAAPQPWLRPAGDALERHRQAAAAAAEAAAAAATPRIAPATAYALGVLHADQRHEVEAARFAFGRHWRPPSPGLRGVHG